MPISTSLSRNTGHHVNSEIGIFYENQKLSFNNIYKDYDKF